MIINTPIIQFDISAAVNLTASGGVGENIKVEGEQVKAEIDARDLPEGEYLRWIKVQLPDHVHLVRVIPPFARVEVKNE